MMNTQELKTTVSKLSPDQLLKFAEWFEEFMADQWDKKIEADIVSVRLDAHGQASEFDTKFSAVNNYSTDFLSRDELSYYLSLKEA